MLSDQLHGGRTHTTLQPRNQTPSSIKTASGPQKFSKNPSSPLCSGCGARLSERALRLPLTLQPGHRSGVRLTRTAPATKTHRPFGAPRAEPGSGGSSCDGCRAAAALRKCRRSGPAGSATPRPTGRCPGPQRVLRAAPVREAAPGGRSSPAARSARAPGSMAAAGGAFWGTDRRARDGAASSCADKATPPLPLPLGAAFRPAAVPGPPRCWAVLPRESQNNRINWVGKDLRDHRVQSVAQNHHVI